MQIVGERFNTADFAAYALSTIGKADWRGQFIVLHNTESPSLAERPDGFDRRTIDNLQSYYESLGWHAGPHLFVDQNGIWVFSPLDAPGVHSPSWNRVSYGVEQLGDYDIDEYLTGDGAKVRSNAISAIAAICHAASIQTDTLRLHRMDPKTDHKHCPGKHCSDNLVQIKRDAHNAAEAAKT